MKIIVNDKYKKARYPGGHEGSAPNHLDYSRKYKKRNNGKKTAFGWLPERPTGIDLIIASSGSKVNVPTAQGACQFGGEL
jgi:hypothetical protein